MKTKVLKRISIILLSILLIISTLLTGFIYTFAETGNAGNSVTVSKDDNSGKQDNQAEEKTKDIESDEKKESKAEITGDDTVTISKKNKDILCYIHVQKQLSLSVGSSALILQQIP